MLDIHLSQPDGRRLVRRGPGGSRLALAAGVQGQAAASGTTIVTTNANGQVRLHLSAGVATFYIDFQGWFSGT